MVKNIRDPDLIGVLATLFDGEGEERFLVAILADRLEELGGEGELVALLRKGSYCVEFSRLFVFLSPNTCGWTIFARDRNGVYDARHYRSWRGYRRSYPEWLCLRS